MARSRDPDRWSSRTGVWLSRYENVVLIPLIALFSALMLGFIGKLIEDWTVIGAAAIAPWRNPRSWWTFGMAVIWVILYALITLVRREKRTFYYLRLQEASHVPVHDKPSELVQNEAQDFRAIRRVYPDTDDATEQIDLVAVMDEFVAELERATNDDDDATLFEMAPDLPWPAALRIGFDWTPRPGTRMVELGGTGADGEPRPPVRWVPTTARSMPAGVQIVTRNDSVYQGRAEADRVLVTLWITSNTPPDGDPHILARTGRYREVRHVHAVTGEDRYHSVRLPGSPPREPLPPAPAGDTRPEPAPSVEILGAVVAAHCRAALHAVYRDFEDQPITIEIAARIPKTIAFVLGRELAATPLAGTPKGTHPGSLVPLWSRFELLHFHLEPRQQRYLPMLVHPVQRPSGSPNGRG